MFLDDKKKLSVRLHKTMERVRNRGCDGRSQDNHVALSRWRVSKRGEGRENSTKAAEGQLGNANALGVRQAGTPFCKQMCKDADGELKRVDDIVSLGLSASLVYCVG